RDVRGCEQVAVLTRRRGGGPFVDMPDIRVPLREFRDRILKLAAECRRLGKRCIFLTQPSIMQEEMSGAALTHMWFGWVGPNDAPRGFVQADDLARAMELYNATLLSTCATDGLECYDLAAAVPRSTEFFYDDFHFTDAGARVVGEYLAHRVQLTH